jgi:hypothetical protein
MITICNLYLYVVSIFGLIGVGIAQGETMQKLWTLLAIFVGVLAATPSHAVLCDTVFRQSSCPAARCDEARACIGAVSREWTEARCMRSPAEAQGEIAAACGQCNQVCDSPTAWMSGTWSGTGYQEGDKSSWSMRLTVRAGSYSIEYPSLGCGGYWSLQNTGSGVASFVERITFGRDKCVDGGNVTIGNLGGGRMQFRWSSPEDTASATLTRQ